MKPIELLNQPATYPTPQLAWEANRNPAMKHFKHSNGFYDVNGLQFRIIRLAYDAYVIKCGKVVVERGFESYGRIEQPD